MSYMEDNYQLPASQSQYVKLQEGINKFRILSKSINGRIDRDKSGKKPKPVRTQTQPEKSFNKDEPSKHFRAFAVWNYTEEVIQILEITQRGIQKTLYGFFSSDEWGDPRGYDIKIDKKGKGINTEYAVAPLPPKAIDKKIIKDYEDMDIHLELLFEGADPFDYKGRKEKQVDADMPF